MKRLKIVHVITTIDLGGAEKQLLILASAQKKRGADVEVIYLKDNPELKESLLNADIKVNEQLLGKSFLGQILLLRKILKFKGKVVHAHLPRAELLCALSLPSKSFIVSRHNSELFFPGVPSLVSILLSRFVAKRAYIVIAISCAVEEYLRFTGQIPKISRCEVIYYGLADSHVKRRPKSKINEQILQLGTVARLVPQKNIPLLINIANELQKRGIVQFHLTIVGVGPLKQELKSMVKSLKLEGYMTWLGQTNHVDSLYKEFDIFLLSSNYEGFGLVLLEAMVNDVPIVARRVSAIPEVLGVTHPGLVDGTNTECFAEKIEQIYTDKLTRLEYLEFQRRQVVNFSIERTAEEHNFLYEELLREQHGS